MASLTKIASNEKGSGNILFYISYVISTLIIFRIFTILNSGEVKVAFLFLPFLLFSLGLYLMGSFLNKKFERLGKTPLTVTSPIISKGIKQNASIFINKKDFNRVNNIKLVCLYTKYSTSGGTVLPATIYEKELPVKLEFNHGTTTLNFEFEIPENMPSAKDETPKVKIDWQFSFKFMDGIEEVSRTWTIKVK